MSVKNSLIVLAVCFLILPFAAPADAAGRAPWNGVRYDCDKGASFKSITFHLNGSGDLRRGTCDLVFPDGRTDSRKCDIFWHNNSPNWEFTLVRQAQCRNMYLRWDRSSFTFELHFEQCGGVQNTVCEPA